VQDYSLGDVARILKVSPRRLRYWQKTQLVDSFPLGAVDEGYAFRDLVCLRSILSLLDKGIPLQRIRRNLELLRDRLPEMDDPAAALRLWDENSDRLVVRRDGQLEEVEGQLLLEFGDESASGRDAVTCLADLDRSAADDQAPVESDDALAWFERGCELDAEPGHSETAIEAYEKAIELEHDFADAYCNLGAVRYNRGQHREARHAFEACIARQADHIEANFNLASVLEEEGEDDLALAHYLRALATDPLYPDLHINLALLYEKLGRTQLACEHWRRYLQLDPRGLWADVARLRLEREAQPGGERHEH
jgi:tetratricopeptide (TPR) repeat protein